MNTIESGNFAAVFEMAGVVPDERGIKRLSGGHDRRRESVPDTGLKAELNTMNVLLGLHFVDSVFHVPQGTILDSRGIDLVVFFTPGYSANYGVDFVNVQVKSGHPEVKRFKNRFARRNGVDPTMAKEYLLQKRMIVLNGMRGPEFVAKRFKEQLKAIREYR